MKFQRHLRKTVALFAVTAILTTGCRSNEEYKKLTDAGNKYAIAVDELLTVAGDIRVDKTSEQLLQIDRDSVGGASREDYDRLSKEDEERLKILNDIREHNKLLSAYFKKLNELATSDAPNQAQQEITGIVGNLNQVSQRLQGSPLVANRGLPGAVGTVILRSEIRGALRNELEARKETIVQELALQEEMLKLLSDSMQNDVALMKSMQLERLVIQPLLQQEAIAKQDEWIQTRKDILKMESQIKALTDASRTLGQFKQVFQAFLEGKDSQLTLASLLQDVETFLALVNNN